MNIEFNFETKPRDHQVHAGQIRTDGEITVLVINGHYVEDEEELFNTIIIHTTDEYFDDIVLRGMNEPMSSVSAEEVYKEFPFLLEHVLHVESLPDI